MDVHAPLAITEVLRRRGVEVLTAQEDETDQLEDPPLLDRARELGRVLFTQDEDFLHEGVQQALDHPQATAAVLVEVHETVNGTGSAALIALIAGTRDRQRHPMVECVEDL